MRVPAILARRKLDATALAIRPSSIMMELGTKAAQEAKSAEFAKPNNGTMLTDEYAASSSVKKIIDDLVAKTTSQLSVV